MLRQTKTFKQNSQLTTLSYSSKDAELEESHTKCI